MPDIAVNGCTLLKLVLASYMPYLPTNRQYRDVNGIVERLGHMQHAHFTTHKAMTLQGMAQCHIILIGASPDGIPARRGPDRIITILSFMRTLINPVHHCVIKSVILVMARMDLEGRTEGSSRDIKHGKAEELTGIILPDTNVLIGVKNSILVDLPDQVAEMKIMMI